MSDFFDRLRPYPELKTAIVNLSSGTAFRAVIWRRTGPFIVLRNAEMLQDRGSNERHVVNGEVVVKLSDIDFIQVIG